MARHIRYDAKPAKAPALRKPEFERLICDAIRRRVLVHLLFKDDVAERLFEAAAVYTSTRHKVNVSGVQITNPARPSDNFEPHDFEIGLIRSIRLTDMPYAVNPAFNRFESKYAKGIICSV